MGSFKEGKLYTDGIEVIKILRTTSDGVTYVWLTGSRYENGLCHRLMEGTFANFKLKLHFNDYLVAVGT